jgi:hypothetical protein
VYRTQPGGYRQQGRPHRGETHKVCHLHTPTTLPLTPLSPHITDPQPTTTTATPTHTTMVRTPQLAPQPTTHHGQQPTTAAAACPRTQDTAQLPQWPQTHCITQCGSTYNNSGHPNPHPNSKDTTTSPNNPQQPLLPVPGHSTLLSCPHRFQPQKAHTSTRHQRWPQHQQGPPYTGQVPMALHTHAHVTQPRRNSQPTAQTATWHCPGAPPPNSRVQPPAAPCPHCPPPALPTLCQ